MANGGNEMGHEKAGFQSFRSLTGMAQLGKTWATSQLYSQQLLREDQGVLSSLCF